MTESLSGYIDSELKDVLPNFKWRLIKNSKKKLIELYVTFCVDTNDTIQVQDALGQNNEPGKVQFEDVICFYDPAYSHAKPQNYLAAIAFDSNIGIDKGFVDAILRQLNLTTKQGMVELREFLMDDFAGEYELVWNNSNVDTLVKTLQDTGRYKEEKLMMDFNEDLSFVQKIKKDDDYDGVERV